MKRAWKGAWVEEWLPGLIQLKNYDKSWLGDDVRAALSVVAVALPVAIAYAQLTGVSAIVGLYSCVLPMLVYALMGTSRQLIVGPDTATCAVIAAVVTPLSAGDTVKHWQLVITMTAMTGVWCLIASKFKLGVFADFLSRPILLGLLNGVSITIIVDQFFKVFGITYNQPYLIEQVWEAPSQLVNVHWQTLLVSAMTFGVYYSCKKLRPRWPAAMLAIIIASLFVWLGNFDSVGVGIVGMVEGGLPAFQAPEFDIGISRELVMPALNLAMVSFVSMMITARSFAAKNGYDIDADKEFRALGMINIASAFSQGFVVSGTSSRTAVNDANGGKTQLVSIISAAIIAIVAVVAYQPLQFIPVAALGVVLIVASMSLIDLKGIWLLRRRNKDAFYLSSITFVAVLVIGVIPGITLAVLLGLFQFLRIVMRPTDQVLGLDSKGTVRSLGRSGKAHPIPGLVIYRFNSPLTYFNADHFKRRLLYHVAQAGSNEIRYVIIDAVASFTHLDLSVMAVIDDIQAILKKRGIRLVLAGHKHRLKQWCALSGVKVGEGGIRIRADMYLAIKMSGCYQEAVNEGQVPEVAKEKLSEETKQAQPEV
ncbi:SulP family inorganic anion transporter [Vibrio gangliei]|uniref:SulP family inorganic anion transporter n=1 Tax=Vibrio gangliei TaxID=2077090 RepID=UPI000D01BAF8|nr:SulP family inorganic anion transporter [Vibrio gangliei]